MKKERQRNCTVIIANPPRSKSKQTKPPTEGVEMDVGDVHIKVDKVHGQVIGTVVVNGDMIIR